MSTGPGIKAPEYKDGLVPWVIHEIITNPVNLSLAALIVVLLYKIIKKRFFREKIKPPALPKIRKDMTVSELKQYDGTQGDGRVLLAVNGWIFDVTERGKMFYGPGAPYAVFGGKDASRGLATFSVKSSEMEHDDLSDLNSMEMESVKEWEAQFREKYDLVGRLLKPGEEPTNYSDEESEDMVTSTTETDKKTS